MARIKLFGIPELVELNDAHAIVVDKMWKDDSYDKETIISAGTFSATKKDIRYISLPPKESTQYNETDNYIKEYNEYRNSLLALEPRQRAEKVAWPHFKLFYYGLYNKLPDEKDKEKVIEHCTKFFEEKNWARPSCLIWYEFLGGDSKSKSMNRMTFQVLARCEERELVDIYEGKKYTNELREQERKGEIAVAKSFDKGYEISVEDINF